ncbi:hypothetical protein BJ878DRAFT_510730 [Calycina marina]|uniref:Uncharacterized protein n=1 Tax=Calycina marina TaxID=1763456 RepID=A0A9P7Z154_9HELO|nr:hypothetical protein BJ878DRAFT_510730 [Calycina marina]
MFASLLNERLRLWREGAALNWTMGLFRPLLQHFHRFNPTFNTILLMVMWVAGVIELSTVYNVTLLVCMNPTSKRHWRQMTKPAYGLIVGEVICAIFWGGYCLQSWCLSLNQCISDLLICLVHCSV